MKRLLLILTLALSGCQFIPQHLGYFPQTQMEKQLADLKARQDAELNKAIVDLRDKDTAYLNKILGNFQSTADWLYGGRLGVELVTPKDRLWTVIDHRLETAATYAPPPSREALETMNKTLKEELDTSKVSNEELNKRYQLKEDEAKAAVKDQELKAQEVAAQKKVIDDMKDAHAKELTVKQDEAIREANKQTADAIKANDDKHTAAQEKNKHQIMVVCGAVSLIALLVAIFSPVYKREAGIFAAITGGVALLVPFLEPIHLNILYGCGLAYIAFLVIKKQIVSEKARALAEKTSSNLINSVQDLKETKPDAFKELQPILADRNTVYVDGNKTAPDKEVTDHIDSVLRDYDRK